MSDSITYAYRTAKGRLNRVAILVNGVDVLHLLRHRDANNAGWVTRAADVKLADGRSLHVLAKTWGHSVDEAYEAISSSLSIQLELQA